MLAITLGVVIAALVAVAVVRLAARRQDPDAPAAYEPGGGPGNVPGYMPGLRQKQERYDEASTAAVEPPHPHEPAIDLDANTMHVTCHDRPAR